MTEGFGRYELLSKLATGATAEIFLARSTGTAGFEKLVVIKRITPSAAQDRMLVSAFLDESRLAATLRHNNIATVVDIGGEDGNYFIAMEYVHGQDLRRIRVEATQRQRPVPLAVSLAIVTGAAQALAYAHEMTGPNGPLGVVHRDVSPSNILVSYEGAVKLVDFGIARATGRTTQTLTGQVRGKVSYMSPEQARGLKLDGRSDLFSLGVVLYELTVGRRPFDAGSDLETLERIVQGRYEPPTHLIAGYPPALEAVIMRMLAAEPRSRFPSANAALPELEQLMAAAGMFNPALGVARYMKDLFAEEISANDMDDEVRTSPTGKKRKPRLPTEVTVNVGRTMTEQDPLDPIALELLADLEANAMPDETREERTRRRIEALLECAFACHGVGDMPRARIAVALALAEDPGSALTNELVERHRGTIDAVLQSST
jgi:serine/threonine-protein kinase